MNDFVPPNILQCFHYIKDCVASQTRQIKDYELNLCVDGKFDAIIDGTQYKISKGDFVFRKPGQILTDFGDINAYIITLDFSGEVNIPPDKYTRDRTSKQQRICHPDVLNNIPSVFPLAHYIELKNICIKILDCFYPNTIDAERQTALIEEFLFCCWQMHISIIVPFKKTICTSVM